MPKIAVITPYFREPLPVLAQCHHSVLSQGPDVDHFMIADGFAREEVGAWNVQHVVLPASHGDGGSTPRGVGSILADAQGYDFIAYLDADNWYAPGHLASLLELHRTSGAPVCSCFRTFHQPDGTQLDITETTEDLLQHVDTSCFLLHRHAFEVLAIWAQMPRQLGSLCDRVFLAGIRKHRLPMASTRQRTVAYRTLYQSHYDKAGLPLPEGFKANGGLQPAMDWLQTKEGVDVCLHRLGFWPLSFL